MPARINIEEIEQLITRLDELDRKEAVMSSLAWSFAMSIGQTIVRQERIFMPDDPVYDGWSYDRKAETTQRLDDRLDSYAELVGWAAAQANPDFLPSGEEVYKRLIATDGPEKPVTTDDVGILAKEMDLTEAEVKELQQHNAERFKQEQLLQAEAAKSFKDRIVRTVDQAIDNTAEFNSVDTFDAIRMVERIADKAADYAFNTAAAALRQRRAKRRNTLNSDARMFRDIETQADKLLTRLEREAEASTDESPVETTCGANENDGRDPERGGVYGSGQLSLEERQEAEQRRRAREAEEEDTIE